VGTLRFAHPTAPPRCQTAAIVPRRHAPEDLLFRFALEKRRGRRESRVPSSTRDRAHKVHTGDRKVRRNTRPSLRNGFTTYGALSPATNSSCHRRWRIGDLPTPGRASKISASLTPATGARTTRFCRPRLPPPKPLDRLMCCRPKFRRRRLSAARLRAGLLAHRPRPALRSRSRPTLPRPSHPAPNVRDDRDTPL
jgi:hypothetical protein